ncbi:MAG: STAS domain-containing protein [Burkholderiales bacterium]|nr:MAG: STAS domain-containing protein [Burkholderiales bacterium]
MAEQPKDSQSFFRKVVRFVANPATDWADLSAPQEAFRETELEKSELKAMIARKRRNDFVRKREFDMLRKVRREGLTPEQLMALGSGSSETDDSEVRPGDSAKQDAAVKAKIDAIEKQMVGDGLAAGARRTAAGAYAKTDPGRLGDRAAPAAPRMVPQLHDVVGSPDFAAGSGPAVAAPTAAAAAGRPGFQSRLDSATFELNNSFSLEISEVVHDPELDEAVIAFANADFDQCEQSLTHLTSRNGPRAQHADTWLVRFDLYRAIGEQTKFESLAVDYAQQFGWSAPQWFSMPRLVAESASEEKAASAGRPHTGDVGWVCPAVLDNDAVAQLQSQLLQLPQPWVLDFSAITSIDLEACARFSEVLRHWTVQAVEMRWLEGSKLLRVLAEATPTGERDVDPAVWALRLDVLRAANRPDEFDEAAIDYCVTYEVSPPSWEPPRATVRIAGANLSTQSPPLSLVGDVSTFIDSSISERAGTQTVASVELAGQLVGDISALLARLDGQLHSAPYVNVSCAKLIRVDFIAAGDLLNWVLKQRDQNRTVTFVDAHRLVALFFGAMGITEHAKIKVTTT